MNTIKIQTVQDFEKGSGLGKTKKHSTKACESCRKLKIRCREVEQSPEGSGTESKACAHCVKLGRQCLWPEEDGRRRPRNKFPNCSRISSDPPEHTYPLDRTSEELSRQTSLTIDELGAYHDEDEDSSGIFADSWQSKAGSLNSKVGSNDLGFDHFPSYSISNTYDQIGFYTNSQHHRPPGPMSGPQTYKRMTLPTAFDTQDTNLSHRTGQDCPIGSLLPIFDNTTGLPCSILLSPLLDAFFDYYSETFCFLNRTYLDELIQRGEVSTFLICAMCALSSRFCQPDIFHPYFDPFFNGHERERWEYSLPFIEQGKKLLMPFVNVPSCDVVAGVLFMALADLGANNEAGMWMFTGMSLRMAQELGLHHENPPILSSICRSPTITSGRNVHNGVLAPSRRGSINKSSFERSAQNILFWCVFVQDICISSSVGRTPGFKRSEINTRLPSALDLANIHAGPSGVAHINQYCTFPEMIRMMFGTAESIEFFNIDPRWLFTQARSGVTPPFENIRALRQQLQSNYNLLSQGLQLGANFYQRAVNMGQAAPYLMIHLNYHLYMTFLTQEITTRAYSPNNDSDLYRASLQSIVDLLTVANFIDDRPLLSNTFLTQPFFYTATLYMQDLTHLPQNNDLQKNWQNNVNEPSRHPSSSPMSPDNSTTSSQIGILPHRPSSSFNQTHKFHQPNTSSRSLPPPPPSTLEPKAAEQYSVVIAKSNYQFLRKVIKDTARYYAGTGWIDGVLDQRELNLQRDFDFSDVSEPYGTYLRLHDLRIRWKTKGTSQTNSKSIPSNRINNKSTSVGKLLNPASSISSSSLDPISNQNRHHRINANTSKHAPSHFHAHQQHQQSRTVNVPETLLNEILQDFDSKAFFNENLL